MMTDIVEQAKNDLKTIFYNLINSHLPDDPSIEEMEATSANYDGNMLILTIPLASYFIEAIKKISILNREFELIKSCEEQLKKKEPPKKISFKIGQETWGGILCNEYIAKKITNQIIDRADVTLALLPYLVTHNVSAENDLKHFSSQHDLKTNTIILKCPQNIFEPLIALSRQHGIGFTSQTIEHYQQLEIKHGPLCRLLKIIEALNLDQANVAFKNLLSMNNSEVDSKNVSVKLVNCQFVLRIPKDTEEKFKKKCAELNMSAKNYVEIQGKNHIEITMTLSSWLLFVGEAKKSVSVANIGVFGAHHDAVQNEMDFRKAKKSALNQQILKVNEILDKRNQSYHERRMENQKIRFDNHVTKEQSASQEPWPERGNRKK